MPRKSNAQIRAQNKRNEIVKFFQDKFAKTPLDHAVYWDYVDQYMLYYDRLAQFGEMSKDPMLEPIQFIKINAECRQITKEMRSILSFLKLDPSTIPADEGENLAL